VALYQRFSRSLASAVARELPSNTKVLNEYGSDDMVRDEATATVVVAMIARTRSVFISSDTANAGALLHLSPPM
jgi:hypothetical protein